MAPPIPRWISIMDDEDLGKTILEIEARGKRGVGYCKKYARRSAAL
jgi:hypothetical protein